MPESSSDELQLSRAAKVEQLLEDTRKDAEILKRTSNGSHSGESIIVSDTTFAGPDKEVCKATSLSYDPKSDRVHSYSARIVGPAERIKLNYSSHPLSLEINASALNGDSVRFTRRLQFKEVGDNLYELSEGTEQR